MDPGTSHPVTPLLARVRAGDRDARRELVAALHDYLCRLAERLAAAPGAGGPQPSTLVQETAVRLLERQALDGVTDGVHLHARVARVMRTALCDHARRQGAAKRGGGWTQVPLSHLLEYPTRERSLPIPDLLDLHAMLDEFGRRYERACAVATLHFLGRFTMREVAEQLGVSEGTVYNDWEFARAWLRCRLAEARE
jgi:RNA polymerase sigma factor (TIGR02999 family)